MRVLFLIDSLGFGGAQRQICTIATLLKRLGMDVEILTYHPSDFYIPTIVQEGIQYKCIERRTIAGRLLSLRRELRSGNQDVVLAFLKSPALYAELSSLPSRKWGLVVSERSAVPGSHRGLRRWFRLGHLLADYVTVNSHTNRLMIEKSFPSLKGRIVTVYNSVNFELFSPGETEERAKNNEGLQLVVAAAFRALKNPFLLTEALAIIRRKEPGLKINVDWYGPLPAKNFISVDLAAFNKASEIIRKNSLQDLIRFHPPVSSIVDVYRRADALVSASFYEGLSNVICEAMACGRPILASNVSDAGNLVKPGVNGFLFDPTSVTDIAEAILRFAKLTQSERELMGKRSREMAEVMFDPVLVAAKYADILSAAAGRKRISIDHWVPQVPESAMISYLK